MLNLEKTSTGKGKEQTTDIPKPTEITIEFAPKKDITAYELARILPHLIGVPFTDKDWEGLGKKVTRHLIKHE